MEERERAGIGAHLAEPAETAAKRGRKRRAKTDRSDARHLRELLVKSDLPQSWIPPAHVLEARARVRLYKDLEEERTAWLQRVQATLYHQGVPVIASLTSAAGQARLTAAELSPAGREAVEVGLRQLDRLTGELDPLRADLARFSRRQPGCRALRTTHFGIGPITSVAIWAEMGDTRRFTSSGAAVRHTGLDITVYASDTKRARATAPAKGQPRCAGRCRRQPCAPPGRTCPTMPTSWRPGRRPPGGHLGRAQAGPADPPHPACPRRPGLAAGGLTVKAPCGVCAHRSDVCGQLHQCACLPAGLCTVCWTASQDCCGRTLWDHRINHHVAGSHCFRAPR